MEGSHDHCEFHDADGTIVDTTTGGRILGGKNSQNVLNPS